MTPDLTLLLPRSSSSIRLSVEDTVAVIEGDSRHRYIPEGQTSDIRHGMSPVDMSHLASVYCF